MFAKKLTEEKPINILGIIYSKSILYNAKVLPNYFMKPVTNSIKKKKLEILTNI